MSYYIGDFADGVIVEHAFNTRDTSTGALITIAGSPDIEVVDIGTSAVVSGGSEVLTVDRGVTGYHEINIDTSVTAGGYQAGRDYAVRFSGTGTVDGISVTGMVICTFSIENRYDVVTVNAVNGLAPPTNWNNLSIETDGSIASVTTVDAVTTVNGLAANVITAASINALAFESGKFAAGVLFDKASDEVIITDGSVDKIWDEDITVTAHNGAGSAALLLTKLGDEISTRIDGRSLNSILGVTDTSAGTSTIASTLLDDTTMAELGVGAPSATPDVREALMWLYMKARNLQTSTSSAATVSNDAGTTIATSTLSDNGTTFQRGEYA